MRNSQYIMRLAHHDVGGVQLDTGYDVGQHASDKFICFVLFLKTSNVLMINLNILIMR